MDPSSPDNSTAIKQQQDEAIQARQAEEDRKGRIRTGLASIESQFAGFTDDFYNKRAQTYRDYYQPDLDRQAQDARDAVTFGLARAGNLASSVAADKRGRLEQDIAMRQGELESKALGAAQALRSDVATDKSSIERELQATSDPEAATNAALAQAQVRNKDPVEYSPLGDLFTAAAAGIGAAKQNADSKTYSALSAKLFPATGSSRTGV